MTKAELTKALEPYPDDAEVIYCPEDGCNVSIEYVNFVGPPIPVKPFIALA